MKISASTGEKRRGKICEKLVKISSTVLYAKNRYKRRVFFFHAVFHLLFPLVATGTCACGGGAGACGAACVGGPRAVAGAGCLGQAGLACWACAPWAGLACWPVGLRPVLAASAAGPAGRASRSRPNLVWQPRVIVPGLWRSIVLRFRRRVPWWCRCFDQARLSRHGSFMYIASNNTYNSRDSTLVKRTCPQQTTSCSVYK